MGIRWRLNVGVDEKIHILRANQYDVEVDPDIKAGRMIEGRGYFVRVVVDGPSSLANHTINRGGDVAWKGNPSFEWDGKIFTAENTFTLGVENQFPDLGISMSGPDGEVLIFKRGIKVAGEAVQGLQLFASKGLIGEPSIIPPGLGFFFSTSDGLSAMLACFLPQISTPRGVFDTFQADAESPVVKEHQRQSGKVIAIDNPNIIVGGGKALASKPIKLTVNSVRLLRRGRGFDLAIWGTADMSQYTARWTRLGFNTAETKFTAEDDGAVARFDTNERLSMVEIIQNGGLHGTILGLQATIPANIQLLPFDSPIKEMEKAGLRDFSDLEALDDCIGTIQFGVNFMEFDTGEQAGVCVNRILNVRQGFAPGAKLEVSLMLADRAAFVAIVTNKAAPAFEFEEKN